MTREELMKSAEVVISDRDKQILIDLLSACDRILKKYPRSNNNKCSYLIAMGRAKDSIKDAKLWCEELKCE